MVAVLEAGFVYHNFNLEDLRSAVATNHDYGYLAAELEASGNITLQTIRGVAETGVDYISTSKITMSAPTLDLGLDIKIGR